MSAGAKICVDAHHIFKDVIYVMLFAIEKDPFGKALLIKTFQIRSIKIRYSATARGRKIWAVIL